MSHLVRPSRASFVITECATLTVSARTQTSTRTQISTRTHISTPTMSTELFGMEDDTPTGMEVVETDKERDARLRKEFIENGAKDLRGFYHPDNKAALTSYNAWPVSYTHLTLPTKA